MKRRNAMLTAALACLAVGALLILVAASGASAQECGTVGDSAGGKPPPPPKDYAFENGMVVAGDEMLDCRSFVLGFDEWGDQEQARRVLAWCEQAGMPSADPPPEVQAEIREKALPETGGAVALPLVAGSLLLGVGLLSVLRFG